MPSEIKLSNLNDFIFCPISIYFHNLYGDQAKYTYQDKPQLLGTAVHKSIDEKTYSTRSDVLQGIDCFCGKYNLIGKIDLFDIEKKELTERKRKITRVYDGYIFQLYGEYFSLVEMGYEVEKMKLYSFVDNRIFNIDLPGNNPLMLEKFEKTIQELKSFKMDSFVQNNKEKCEHCIYADACDRSLV